MRLAGCLIIEGLVVTALVGGAGVAVVRGEPEIRALRALVEARLAPAASPPATLASSSSSLARLAAREEAPVNPAPAVAAEPSGTFLGMADDLLIERMRAQPVARLKLNRGGSSLSFRVDFADGSRAAWKPAQTNTQTVPRKEVAAYRLNRLLGLDAVPPATTRPIPRAEVFAHLHPDSEPAVPRIRAELVAGPGDLVSGTASYWIPVILDSPLDSPAGHAEITRRLTQGEPLAYGDRAMAAQLSTLIVFDFLAANPDRRSGGNMKTSPDGGKLYFMDNTMSFFLEADGPERNRQQLLHTQRFSRRLREALARVDRGTLRAVMREPDGTSVLTDAEMQAVVARRAFVERHVAALVAEHGEAAVLCFP